MKVDFHKIAEEDPTFREFLKEFLLSTTLADDNSSQILSYLYATYQAGITVEQVTTIAKFTKFNQQASE